MDNYLLSAKRGLMEITKNNWVTRQKRDICIISVEAAESLGWLCSQGLQVHCSSQVLCRWTVLWLSVYLKNGIVLVSIFQSLILVGATGNVITKRFPTLIWVTWRISGSQTLATFYTSVFTTKMLQPHSKTWTNLGTKNSQRSLLAFVERRRSNVIHEAQFQFKP